MGLGMTQANQVQIPSVTTQNDALNQVQQNINKVLRNINNQIVSVQSFVNENTIIGEVKIANLSVTQFQAITGSNWVLCNGQSCIGSSYAQMTGQNTVPTISVGSLNNFIRIN